jgi:hypothetical protein
MPMSNPSGMPMARETMNPSANSWRLTDTCGQISPLVMSWIATRQIAVG